MITEPDVALTDYGLALECALFAYRIYTRGAESHPIRNWALLFFAATGAAALAGGTVHGFFLDEAGRGYRILWPATLIATGATGLSAWAIGAKIQFSQTIARRVTIAALLEFAGYALAVLFAAQTFLVAVVNYLPPALFLLVVLILRLAREPAPQLRIGIAGLLLTFVGAGIQQAGIALHPVYFNHNALYHLVQAVALFLIFYYFRWLTARSRRFPDSGR